MKCRRLGDRLGKRVLGDISRCSWCINAGKCHGGGRYGGASLDWNRKHRIPIGGLASFSVLTCLRFGFISFFIL